MENHTTSLFFFIFIFIFIFLSIHSLLHLSACHAQLLSVVEEEEHEKHTQIYVIDVDKHPRHELLDDEDLRSWHNSFLPNSTLDSGAPRLVYSYRHVISGFAAHLTPSELKTVKSKPGFIRAQPNRYYHIETTYTPSYLGLTKDNGWGSTMMGNDIIIGIIDTGIKPIHPSFNDSGMHPPPATKWKGNCSYRAFPCNNKIISAKAFSNGSHPSPLDTDGHGTHVASTAAGSFVDNANVLGMATGTSSGMAPLAHLAIYKVCYPNIGCGGIDIYEAIDRAIKDGVDIISMSLSGDPNDTFYDDMVSRGSMAAIQNRIIPVAAAGNSGPNPMTLSHSAPWVLTVGASTTDRRTLATVKLGDGQRFLGESAYQPKTWNNSIQWPLEYPGKNRDISARACASSALANLNLRGKIVLCEIGKVDTEEKGKAAYQAGAEGMILLNQPEQGNTIFSDAHILPATWVPYTARVMINKYYYKNQTNATAGIRFTGTKLRPYYSPPALASFSSRGPGRMNGGIIKPDVLAPGVNILAAWHVDVGPNPNPLATHTFNFLSGTSMATPHVAGIAALVKTKHLGWTPSEIISAIVTTANDSWTAGSPGHIITDNLSNQTAGIYRMGAGQVRPINAMDPGLVFGQTSDDYIGYLCGLGYDPTQIFLTAGKWTNCSSIKQLNAMELNYPSIAVNLTMSTTRQKASRAAKNVGDAREEYTAKITEPAGVKIYLSTYSLKFTRVDQVESYEMTFEMSGSYPSRGSEMIRRGKIVWDSGKHVVTTPIAIRFV